MRILLVNDDGYQAQGLKELRVALGEKHQVMVVAPDRERSAIGHAFSLSDPLRLHSVSEDFYWLNGTPADCTYVGIYHLWPGTIDLVVSGINHGPNLGQDTFYSGTVAGAREAAFCGVPALAVSLVSGTSVSFAFAAQAVDALLDGLPRPFLARATERKPRHRDPTRLLNINIPNHAAVVLPWRWEWTHLGWRNYDTLVDVRYDPRGDRYLWIGGGELFERQDEFSDIACLERGFISITPLALDNSHYPTLQEWAPGVAVVGDSIL